LAMELFHLVGVISFSYWLIGSEMRKKVYIIGVGFHFLVPDFHFSLSLYFTSVFVFFSNNKQIIFVRFFVWSYITSFSANVDLFDRKQIIWWINEWNFHCFFPIVVVRPKGNPVKNSVLTNICTLFLYSLLYVHSIQIIILL